MTQVVKRADLSKKGPKLLKIATIATFWTKIAFSHFFKPQNRTTKGCESHLKPARIRASKTALFAINRTIWKPWDWLKTGSGKATRGDGRDYDAPRRSGRSTNDVTATVSPKCFVIISKLFRSLIGIFTSPHTILATFGTFMVCLHC